jgi:shikimate kinase
MKNLVLFGFMGTGKSTVGQWSAERLGMLFVDMDQLIEQRHGQTITHIFKNKGEPFFRQLERGLVRELAGKDGLVVSTGGGVALDPGNVAQLAGTGVLICLWAEPRVIYERTKRVTHRPLMQGDRRLGRIKKLLHDRESAYRAIPNLIDTSQMGLEQVVDEVIHIYRKSGDTGQRG